MTEGNEDMKVMS